MKKWKIGLIASGAVVLAAAVLAGGVLLGGDPLRYKSRDFERYLAQKTRAEAGGVPPGDGIYTVSESDSLTLRYDTAGAVLSVTDKRNGYVWSTSASGRATTESEELAAGLKPICAITYTDFEENNDSEHAAGEGVTITAAALKDGVRLHLDFSAQGIAFDLCVWLEGDAVVASVPADSITEGHLKLVSVELFPMLGAARADEEGYIVFPDGSGALFRFDSRTAAFPSPVYADVYSPLELHLEDLEEQERTEQRNTALPAFGMVKGANGFVGYICDGDDSAVLSLLPQGHIYDLSRVTATIRYRKTYTFLAPDKKEVSAVEKERRAGDFTVRYMFTCNPAGESYSGLAGAVRRFLLDSGRMKPSAGRETALNVHFLMGAMKNGLLFDSYAALTTFDQAADILADLKEAGCDRLTAMLYGWQSTGFGRNPTMLPVAGKAGGESGLKAFFSYADAADIPAYLSTNLAEASAKGRGYSKARDLAEDIMRVTLSDEDGSRYLLNPLRQAQRLEGQLSTYKKLGASGLGLDSIGRLIYDDYNPQRSASRRDAMGAWAAMASMAGEALGSTAVQNGNAYLLPYASRLYDISDTDSHNALFEDAIPFYQLVVHGSIPYTSSTAGNMAHDFVAQKLKWIEYGSEPWFILTAADTTGLKDTEVDKLFSTRYADYKESVTSLAKEYQERLSGIADKAMVAHVRLADGVYKTVFEGGVTIYVNYNEAAAVCEGGTVPARDYLVVRREGGTR